jgi:hypothetical protein
LVQFQVWTFRFFGLGLGVEASLDIVVALAGKLLDAARAQVMIGERQSVGRNE